MSKTEDAFDYRAKKILKRSDKRLAKVIREGEIRWNRLVWKFLFGAFIALLTAVGLAIGVFRLTLWLLETV